MNVVVYVFAFIGIAVTLAAIGYYLYLIWAFVSFGRRAKYGDHSRQHTNTTTTNEHT